ncbi:hypothetical protein [Corallococcus sp. EGB]|uniref:hypothetical protein n=1 Tax=Corallococcus sp. EGB TaxID=1521117 RepID=UPI001CBB4FE6|nr:hypothetical protein [Corallococcus sp. EGB]
MKPLHQLAEALVVLAREGWTSDTCDVADLQRQVREMEALQAQVQEKLRAAQDAMDACTPDGTLPVFERWLRLQRRQVDAGLSLGRIAEAEALLRAEVERQLWLALHRRAGAEVLRAAA